MPLLSRKLVRASSLRHDKHNPSPALRCSQMSLSARPTTLGKLLAIVVGVLSIGAFAPASAAYYNALAPTTGGTDGRVSDILTTSKFVYVAGSFTQVNTPSAPAAVPYVARFDPTTGEFDASWHPDPDGPVLALALSPDGSTLYLGGDFGTVSEQAHRKLAAVSTGGTGSAVRAWKPKVNGPVKALASDGGYLYVGGKFETATSPDKSAFPLPNIARLDASTGYFDKDWGPQPDAQVLSVVPAGDHVFVGGEFTSISGKPATKSIATLSTGSALPVAPFFAATNQGASPMASDLYLDGPHLLAAVGGAGGACASLNASTGKLEWSKHTNGNVQAVTAIGGVAYCGGHFGGAGSFDGTFTRHKLAAVDQGTGQTTDFAPRVNRPLGVWSLDADSNGLYVGGDFTRVSGKDRLHFAVFQ